ncbi:hypothetical protein Lser_V15G04417 [Lactuca serriola]
MMIAKLLRLGRRQLNFLISRETIKPSSPTPSHLHIYNLSEVDQLADKGYMPLVLFYANNGNCSLSAHDKALTMKKSLSESLTRYYPLAGRLPSPTTPYVCCNDDGVVFVETKIQRQLDSFKYICEQDENLKELFADDLLSQKSLGSSHIVGVQLNHFSCGGLALGVSMSHTIGDACTLLSFVNHWASVSRYGSADHRAMLPLNPHIIHSPITNSVKLEAHVVNQVCGNRVKRKFVFPNKKLIELKNKVTILAEAGSTPFINNPTRVEVLTTLLYKTALVATLEKTGCLKPSYLLMMGNIRNKFIKKLPQNTMGNLVSVLMVHTRHATEISLNGMVAEIKKQKSMLEGIRSVHDAAENITQLRFKLGNDDIKDVAKRSYWCSSLCGLPYNKPDFGWGKPMGASLALLHDDRNGFLLTDTPDGDGIEALVFLEKEDMEIFQTDKEMLSFCQTIQ